MPPVPPAPPALPKIPVIPFRPGSALEGKPAPKPAPNDAIDRPTPSDAPEHPVVESVMDLFGAKVVKDLRSRG